MSIGSILRLRRDAPAMPSEPALLSWRRAVRERKAEERELRDLVRRFARGQ